MKKLNYVNVKDKLVNDLRSFLGDKKAVIGISGGIDSAVVASLCVRAVGADRVIGVQMPYGDQSTEDGSTLIKNLGIKDNIVNIKHIVQSFPQMPPSIINNLTNGNIRARVRMTLLYAYAGTNNGFVIGTSNKTETLLGYFTKYGDGGCDVEPIGDLYKTDIFGLARNLKDIPDKIITKSPSAELWEGQTDEGEIGMTYAEMDGILKGMDTQKLFYDRVRFIALYGENKVVAIEDRVRSSEHKRKIPPIFSI